jgi:hypothetical protein
MTLLKPASDGYLLDRRVRPVHDDHLPRWQEREGLAAARVGDWNLKGS